MTEVEIKNTDLKNCVGLNIILRQIGTSEFRKLRLTKVKGDKLLGLGHDGKQTLYYEFNLENPNLPDSRIFKIIN